mgnify:CR=1 FL=1
MGASCGEEPGSMHFYGVPRQRTRQPAARNAFKLTAARFFAAGRAYNSQAAPGIPVVLRDISVLNSYNETNRAGRQRLPGPAVRKGNAPERACLQPRGGLNG